MKCIRVAELMLGMEFADRVMRKHGYEPHVIIDAIEAALNKITVIDAEPVVRCKDCRYSYFESHRVPHEQNLECDKMNDSDVKPDGFCSYGEKMIGGETDDQPGTGVSADG